MMDTIQLKGIKFNFRNLKTYPEEGAMIIRHFKEIKPFLEKYLEGKTILPEMQDKLWGSDNYVFILITQDIVATQYGILLGCVGALKRSENMLIELRVPPKNRKKDVIILETLVHEILHIFVESEEKVRQSTKEFMTKYSDQLLKILNAKGQRSVIV